MMISHMSGVSSRVALWTENTLYIVRWTVDTEHETVDSIGCLVITVQWNVHTVQLTVYNVWCAVQYSVQKRKSILSNDSQGR